MTKRPCSSLRVERDKFVLTSVAVIFTPGTSAPEESATVPPIRPRPCPNVEIGTISNTARIIRRPMVSSARDVSYSEILLRYARFADKVNPGRTRCQGGRNQWALSKISGGLPLMTCEMVRSWPQGEIRFLPIKREQRG